MKNRKSNFGFSYMYIKYGKFWSISLGYFIKHKPLFFWRVTAFKILKEFESSSFLLTSIIGILAVEVRIESFGTHFVDFVDIIIVHMVDELFPWSLWIDGFKLLLIHMKHLVDSTFVFELKKNHIYNYYEFLDYENACKYVILSDTDSYIVYTLQL